MSFVDSAPIISPIAKGTKRAAPPTNGTVRVTRSKAAQCETAEVPTLVKIFNEAEALPDPDATDADYEPVAPAEEEPEEETNEQCDAGDVVDDERPPFADADPKPADPAPGREQILGRFDMVETFGTKLTVSRQQAAVQVGPDGTATVYSIGKPPTGFRRSPYEPWAWLQHGQSMVLSHGCKISLDAGDPEGAVYKCEMDDGSTPGLQGGGYGQAAGGQGTYVQAIADFNAQQQGDLGFRQGDVVQVVEQRADGWWKGSLNGQLGWFPSNFCSEPFYGQ